MPELYHKLDSVVELAAAQQAQIKAIEELRKAPTEEKMLL
ncbi:hypothetical protein PtrV1_12263 [Pyrenophora tritici-repentis]|uniref:Uncharacterized protein n=1 Tax=Pyrenophora tritici-repentis TaxID=45151 RepID=A0A5M9KTL7_9PLEO|nr:hypothetical protein PtrV1_12263 [Pyrenophora tritici-repentis]KAF7445063.1 hypothetical protein A1F99_100490 [Pyrenophora tritici-repentis]KAF7565336.1 hypothetical protein PtrM4_047700 [Pyrenophora tritici-repentis]KAI1512409.1 hypothetical protein Ptr86124_008375 [Pyrenophora tritici-repentis]KAI1677969.1 hypothetical protein KJE20_12905 [Pyrenophora tritici-repentis]